MVLTGLVFSLSATPSFAAGCDVNIEATASMAFTLKEIAVAKTCKEITLNFKNTGTMKKDMMGHNVVITKASDMQAVVTDGMAAGLASNYVKPNDARVIGHTVVIGGGESTSTKIKLTNVKPADSYMFFCSFPGHSGVMKGTFTLI